MKKLSGLLKFSETKRYLLVIAGYSLASYSLYLVFDENFMIKVGLEDGVIEYLTAGLFLAAALLSIKIYYKNKLFWFALLAIVFFVGFGEEISWGQRILGYSTPESIDSKNIQGEFNIHNLEPFNPKDFSGTEKSGWKKLLSVQFLYNLFWFLYGVILPLGAYYVTPIKKITEKLRLPVPPFSIGIIFFIDWLIFRLTKSYLLPPGKSLHYYYTINEIFESCSALIFMMILIFFANQYVNSSRKPDQTIS